MPDTNLLPAPETYYRLLLETAYNKAGRNQAELARRMGMTRAFVGLLLAKSKLPSFETMEKLWEVAHDGV